MSMGSMGASGGYLCPTGGWHESNGRCQVGSGVPIPLSRTCLIHHIPACRATRVQRLRECHLCCKSAESSDQDGCLLLFVSLLKRRWLDCEGRRGRAQW